MADCFIFEYGLPYIELTLISDYAFCGCSSLTTINVESQNSNFSSIDGVLFNKDASVLLTFPGGKTGNYVIPNSVTSIGSMAFFNCYALTEVTIPNSVTSIGEDAFYFCEGLTSVTIPNSVTSIGSSAFSNCSGLTQVTIPNSVTEIGGGAFYKCISLTEVTIPNSVTLINSTTFWYCSGLTQVTIPNSVTEIGNGAFALCSGLTQVTIPSSITSIGSSAFYGCSGLTSIYAYPAVPPTLGTTVFDEVTNTIPVHVPAGAVDAYRNAEGWNYFTDFREMEEVELSVSLNAETLELKEGETATLTATISKPEEVTVTAEKWTSSDEAVATVDGGTVTAVAEGKATITYTATFGNGETRTATCEVTVIKQSGIKAISTEANGEAEYFSLQGIRVKADKLAQGVYIRRIGNEVKKIAIK